MATSYTWHGTWANKTALVLAFFVCCPNTAKLLKNKTCIRLRGLSYNKATTNKIMKLLGEVEKDLIKQLKSLEFGTAFNLDRIDKQLESVREINTQLHTLLYNDLVDQMQQTASYEQEWQQKAISESAPIALDMIAVSPTTLAAAVLDKPLEGKILKEWTDKLDADSFSSLQTAVRMGLVEGQTYDQITKRIIGTKALQYTDGIMQLNRVKTQALVSTAVAHSTNVARDSFYKANDDLVKGVQWVSALDSRVTPICRSRDGKIYPLNDGPRPPAHFRCRSAMCPVLKSWQEMGLPNPPEGTRSSLNGQVAETETYQTWLKKQPHAFQDETLGKARAEMFRNGTPLDRFVDDSGKSYTLEQLRQKEGIAEKVKITNNRPMNYIEQKTPKAAAEFLVKHDIVDHADFGKITDMALINDWSKSIHDSVKTYPLLRDEMQFTGSMQVQINEFIRQATESRKQEYIAYGYSRKEALQEANNDLKNRIPEAGGMAWSWNPKKMNGEKIGIGGIVFNEEAEKNWREDISNEIDSGFWAKADKSISYVLNHEIGHKFDRLLDLQNDHEIKTLYESLNQKNKIKDEVSDYANTNISEFISECWAEFTCSKQPRQTAIFVGNRIIEKYKAVK